MRAGRFGLPPGLPRSGWNGQGNGRAARSGLVPAGIPGPDLHDHYADDNRNQKGADLRMGRPDYSTEAG